MAKEFAGKIELDIRDSVPDWEAFLLDLERHLAAALSRD